MPRKKLDVEQVTPAYGSLTDQLVNEINNAHESGQPLIYEQALGSNRLRVTVIWEVWDGVPMEERTSVILAAFDKAEGNKYRKRIALANGLTVPEATAAELLPFQLGTAHRKGDPVTFEQCWKAMLDEGASRLFGPTVLQLRFATREEAEACRQRLIRRLPGSDNVWIITRDVIAQDRITLCDSVTVESTKAVQES